jgi:hypothetical protein
MPECVETTFIPEKNRLAETLDGIPGKCTGLDITCGFHMNHRGDLATS